MRQVPAAIAIAVAAALAWLAWMPPSTDAVRTSVKTALPEHPDSGPEMWRIVTKRMVWKEAIASLRDRLYKEGFETRLIVKQEPIELHAFDDPRVFDTREEAEIAKLEWTQKKINAEVLKREKTYVVGLGRFYLTSYAEQMQNRLKKVNKPYKYERRTVTIPAYRFVFSSMTREKAESAWKKLQNLGIADPVMMREREFRQLYGKAKRSS